MARSWENVSSRASVGSEGRYEQALGRVDGGARELLARIPRQDSPPLAPEWLRWEMLERLIVLSTARLPTGARVIEVGAGPHAICTVPLAHSLGAGGRVVAVEKHRWSRFREVVDASGMSARILPVRADGRQLPLVRDAAAMGLCVHAVRSLRTAEEMVALFREMLRVAPGIFVAESLPIARTEAQAAHLAMYDLRRDVFRATRGRADDVRYLALDELARLVVRAGGVAVDSGSIEVDLPHALAYFPRSEVEGIPPGRDREALLHRWDEANAGLRRYGEDHPPVGFVRARRG